MIIILFMLIALNVVNCQVQYQEAITFTEQLKVNPNSLVQLVEQRTIKVHDDLINDIKNGNYPLKLIAWEISRFFKKNNNSNISFSDDKKAFYSNEWREQFDLNDSNYYCITYSSQNSDDTLKYEFLIDKNNDLILFEIQSNLMRNITDILIHQPDKINSLDSSQDFVLYQTFVDDIKSGEINLLAISDSIKAFNDYNEKFLFQILNNKIYFKTTISRMNMNIDNYECSFVLYYKKNYITSIKFDFLIDTEQDILYLYNLSYSFLIRRTYDE